MALVLAGLALCLLAALPVQAARNTKKYCFPLDTAVWRISDAYGKRTDPFTGKPASIPVSTSPAQQVRQCKRYRRA